MSAEENTLLDDLRPYIESSFPDLGTDQIEGALGAIAEVCGLTSEHRSLDADQKAKALQLIELVKSGQAHDLREANALFSGDVVNIPVPDASNPAARLMQVTRDQVSPVVAPVAQGVVSDVLDDFATAYRPMVEQAVVEAVAGMPPLEVNIAEIVQGKSNSGGGGTFTNAARQMLSRENKALPEANPSES